MYHYEYVSKEEASPYREEFLDIIHEAQDLLRDKFTFRYDFIGSSSHNMITCDYRTNKGFDFDVNLHVNDDEEQYSPEVIKKSIIEAINRVARPRGYEFCEDSTRVITLKKRSSLFNSIEYSCDFAIVYDWTDNKNRRQQQYIRYQKNQNNYVWADQPKGYGLEEKVDWLKKNGFWGEVRKRYLEKKNGNMNHEKKSRALYAEAIHEICQKANFKTL